ncbi:flagellum-specific ATP synthase [Andreprevotia lacus DSM 23236]|jgi:flagellum-specific ATP synthase|uniref:Flagellum-specific ATP synthase n=1 Tax=Andreprevotia lacus DSM 23236 TaxID=1121001 RepID=A0A1W1XUP5_9NEIS|nr:FliI/YscN family ATPase [Andreprevotia lacus]SMC27679.1 flagellum-specific ATP synthase [Andreprevotia lacus DSM 23236]
MTSTPQSVYLDALGKLDLYQRVGAVTRLAGLSIEARGPDAAVGEVCEIISRNDGRRVRAEVVGLNQDRLVLMPYGDTRGIAVGSEVLASRQSPEIGVGDALLGRVIDAFGAPFDGLPPPEITMSMPLRAQPVNPLQRPRIDQVIETGIRAIDSVLTLGKGQRVGIFAGSGVGKSTLLGMIAKHIVADVNVIALIGERGREVKEFIEQQLGPEGLARSVVVVATADMPALARARAAYAATTVAEYFRSQGKQVMLTMDSVTRFAMAKREIGLAAGEPPTARGYTPSVFTELPELCERCGTADGGGSITALYTVLVEGDDFNEPISDILRATLDGHIMLSRKLAQSGHFPAIDVLQSTSRLLPDLANKDALRLAQQLVAQLACYERNREMIEIGAYRKGSNAEIDQSVALMPALQRFLRQGKSEHAPRAAVIGQLQGILQGGLH